MATETKPKYCIYDIEEIKEIPVSQVLADYGITVKNNQFKIREEKTASCRLYEDNHWYDYGNACGGKALELVMKVEDVDFKEAVQILGARYDITIINGEKSATKHKRLSAAEYAYLNLSSIVYKNILTTENADKFSGLEEIKQVQEKYNIQMNALFQKNQVLYEQLIEEKTFPEMKYLYENYLQATRIFAMDKEKYAPSSSEYLLVESFYKSNLSEYQTALNAYTKAVANTRLENTVSLFKIDPEKDLKSIRYKSLEIGDYPYKELKALGKPLEHANMSTSAYNRFEFYVKTSEQPLTIPYSAHIRGEKLTLSFLQEDSNLIKGILGTVEKLVDIERQKEVEHQEPTYNNDLAI